MLLKKSIFHFSKYRKPTDKWYNTSKVNAEKKSLLYFNAGIVGLVFAGCFSMVPLYKLYCQHSGLIGDTTKKDYSGKARVGSVHRKFNIEFYGESDSNLNWDFSPEQKSMTVGAGETSLMFYKAFNREKKPIVGFATYTVHPEEASIYFSKIQCFCFHQQMLAPNEEIMLPLYFYFEPEILDDDVLKPIKKIEISYRFVQVKKQDMARMVEEEETRLEENKRKLEEIRKKKLLVEKEIA